MLKRSLSVVGIIYGDRYSGTWQHGKVGGHMSGRIDKPSAAKP